MSCSTPCSISKDFPPAQRREIRITTALPVKWKRGTQRRADLTAEQRKEKCPDIDRADVVFADGGVSYSYALSNNGLANSHLVKYDKDLEKVINEKGGVILDSYNTLSNFVYTALNTKQQFIGYFGNVPYSELQKIEQSIINKPVNRNIFKRVDYSLAISCDFIRHLKNERGFSFEQIMLLVDRLPDTIFEADETKYHQYKSGNVLRDGLLFEKQYL